MALSRDRQRRKPMVRRRIQYVDVPSIAGLRHARGSAAEGRAQKERPPEGGRYAGGCEAYFVPPVLGLPEAGEAPELAPPGVPKVPLPEVAPALPGDDGVPATWRSPRTSMSTRRSGCRQEISFVPFTPLHWSLVTDSLSPRPSERTLVCSTPFCARYSFTAAARFSESCRL